MRISARSWVNQVSTWTMALTMLGVAFPAAADIIEADFTGVITQSNFFPAPPGTPFAAQFLFDTSLGTLGNTDPTRFQLCGGNLSNCGAGPVSSPLISASITFASFGTFQAPTGFGFFAWTDNGPGSFANITAFARDGGHSFTDDLEFPTESGGIGFFYLDARNPVGPNVVLSEDTRTAFYTSVPGPIAGAGLPGLLLACGGLLGWSQRYRPQARHWVLVRQSTCDAASRIQRHFLREGWSLSHSPHA